MSSQLVRVVWVVATVLAVFTCEAASLRVGAGELGPLKSVVFTHRHGARTSLANINGSCDVLGCGTLTLAGKRMLKSLGESFRARYGSVLPAQYDTSHFSTVSDGSDRVIQSADAFLFGLFNTSEVYPVINTGAENLIDPTKQPGAALHTVTTYPAAVLKVMPLIEKNIINNTVVKEIGKEVGLWNVECDLVPAACLAETIDFVAYAISEGEMNQFPITQEFLPQLEQARLILFQWLFGVFDEQIINSTYNQDAGWEGVDLADAMVSAAAGSKLLSEFSGHDTSLMPLYAALGNLTFSYPEFGTAFILEVYHPVSPATSPRVVPRVAINGQTPQLQTTITFTNYQLTCKSPTGVIYASDPNTGCPLEDLSAFLQTRHGKDAVSISPQSCYAWPLDVALLSCDPAKNSASVAAHSECGKYRSACPFVACGPGRYMTPQLACEKI